MSVSIDVNEGENSNANDTKVAPNVMLSSVQRVFQIYLDGDAYGYCKNATNAKILLEEIADKLEGDLQKDGKRVFRQNLDENTIQISRQTIGFLKDGSVSLKHTLQIRPLHKLYRLRTPPTPPPIPPPPPSPQKQD